MSADLDRLAVLAGRSWHAEPLPGGLTNTNLHVVSDDAGPALDLVVRCAHPGAELLGIDRGAERDNTIAAAAAGVGAPVVEHQPGMLVVGYLPGHTLTDADFADPSVLARAAQAVRTLHGRARFTGDFDMERRRAGYLAVIAERGIRLPPGYRDHDDAWAQLQRALAASARPAVPCNNDLLAANFIDAGDAMWLIDYEYSGNGDACFELGNTAAECGFGEEQVDAWTEAYFDAPSPADRARVRLQMLASRYGWSLWGFIQAAVSPIDYDFWGWGMERYERACAMFTSAQLPRLLTEATA